MQSALTNLLEADADACDTSTEIEAADSRRRATQRRLTRHEAKRVARRWCVPVVLVLLTLIAFGLRAYHLDAAGLSDDEVHKFDAATAYLQGDLSQNLEHPMLMKGAIAASLATSRSWNDRVGAWLRVAEESAVRFPNVVVGALTTIVIFLFAELWYGKAVALASAGFWAISAETVAINRIAKEDTFLVFFCWLAFYAYARAKKYAADEPRRCTIWHGLSGVGFGLMLASKYFPHYLGLNFLFYLVYRRVNGPSPWSSPMRKADYYAFYGLLVLSLLLADPVILSPVTLRYFVAYIGEQTVTHHGYMLMDHLYRNNFSALANGLPVYFYPLLLALKTQLPILALAFVGTVVVIRRRRETPYFFLAFWFVFWMVPFSLLASKWYRYTLSLMPVVTIAAGIGFVALYRLTHDALASRGGQSRVLRAALAVSLVVVAFGQPLESVATAAPHYLLYLNPLGCGRTGYFFPHDEFYDDGVRETIARICAEAPRGATVFGDAPPVFAYYFKRFGRDDLAFCPSYDRSARERVSGPSYVVVQSGRRYFENREFLDAVPAVGRPVGTLTIAGATATRVFVLRDPRDVREPL